MADGTGSRLPDTTDLERHLEGIAHILKALGEWDEASLHGGHPKAMDFLAESIEEIAGELGEMMEGLIHA